MDIDVLIGMLVAALLDMARSQYQDSYGIDPKRSPEFVALIAAFVLLLYCAFSNRK